MEYDISEAVFLANRFEAWMKAYDKRNLNGDSDEILSELLYEVFLAGVEAGIALERGEC